MTENANSGRFRPGTSGNPSGRPRGAVSILNREVAKALASDGGVMPVEVLVVTMRDAWKRWLATGDEKARALAILVAEKAAPYFHRKLAAVEHSGEVTHAVVRVPEVISDSAEWRDRYAPEEIN